MSVLAILGSTSVATWLMINRQPMVIANVAATAPATMPTPMLISKATTAPAMMPATAPAAELPLAQTPAPAPPKPDTTTVHRGTLAQSFNLDGVFEPVDPFELRLVVKRYQGDFTIRKAIAAGSHVAKGDVLLELDPQKIDEQIAMADNDLKLATANRVKAESDVKLGDQSDELAMSSAKDEQTIAQTELKRWDSTDGAANVMSGNLQAKETQAGLDDAIDELNELKKMYKSEDLTNQTADIVMKRAVRGVELQKISNEIAKVQADRAVHFTPPITRQHMVLAVSQQAQAVAQLEASQAQAKVARDAALVTARDAADEAGRRLAELKQDRSMFSIASPIDGVVVYGSFSHKAWTEVEASHFAAGEKAAPEQVLMTVYTPGKLAIAAGWPEARITLLAGALKIKVNPIAIPELNYDGTAKPFSLVGEAKNDEQLFNVPIDLPAVDARLAPGFKADVSVDAGKLDNVLLVPVSAVSHGTVWVHPASGEDQMRTVTVGRTDGHQVEIKDGLSDGDVVLTQGKHAGQNQ